jgi:hypothetical protein
MTAANFNPVIGQSLTYHTFTPTTLTPGSAGANQTWNFAGTSGTSTTSFTYVTPSSTPYGSSFPGSTVASNQNGAYDYLITNNNYMARKGVWASNIPIVYSDEETFITYPFTYSSSFNDNFAASFTSGITFNRSGTINGTADGYGTLILPWGTVNNVLRIHITETYQDVSLAGTQNYSSDIYMWVVPNTHYYLYTLTALTSVGGTSYAGNYIDQASVGITEANPEEILLNTFPNPGTELLNIRYEAKSAAMVQYMVSNTIGQQIYSTEESISGGEINKTLDISAYPAGIYFLAIRMDDRNYIRRFVVNR